MGRLYWLVATLLVAVVAHLGFVLFAPKLVMADKLDAIRQAAGEGALKVLTPEEQRAFIGQEDAGLVHALCLYDLDHGPVRIFAVVPRSYWSISIYSSAGDNFYSFNDRQADVDRLALLLKLEESVLAPGDDVDAVAPEGDTLEVLSPTSRGVAVFRALAAEPDERARMAEFLSRSSCAGPRN